MIDIDYILELINCNNSEENQIKGLKLTKNVECVDVFIKPKYPYGEEVWENCAKILYDKTDKELEDYLFELLEWLHDLNWPGAFIIAERLKKYSKNDKLENAIKNSLLKSKLEKDEVWRKNIFDIFNSNL